MGVTYEPLRRAPNSTTWRFGDFLLNYGHNCFSEPSRFSNTQMAAQPDDLAPGELLWFDARSTHDMQARCEVNDAWVVYGGVNNMFNQEPDQYSESYPVSPVGRFFYVGFTATWRAWRGNWRGLLDRHPDPVRGWLLGGIRGRMGAA